MDINGLTVLPDNVDRLDILPGTGKMLLQNSCLFIKLKIVSCWFTAHTQTSKRVLNSAHLRRIVFPTLR